MWIKLMVIIGVLWLLQVFFGYFQIKHFNTKILELKRKGKLSVGVKKGYLTPGVIVCIVVNNDGWIIDAEIMKGLSVFARFRKLKGIIGKHIKDLKGEIEEYKGREKEAFRKAVEGLDLDAQKGGDL